MDASGGERELKRRREELSSQKCEALLTKLWNQDTLRMFHKPVTAYEAPNYFTIVQHPMDLSTIRAKLRAGNYRATTDLIADVRLMFANALEYNEKGDAWHSHAKAMLKQLRPTLNSCGLLKYDPQDSEDEDFVPDGFVHDHEGQMAKDEAKAKENVPELLQRLQDDLDIPLEELRAKYQKRNASTPVQEEPSSDDDSSDDDDDDSYSDESESGSSSLWGSDDEDEESESDTDGGEGEAQGGGGPKM